MNSQMLMLLAGAAALLWYLNEQADPQGSNVTVGPDGKPLPKEPGPVGTGSNKTILEWLGGLTALASILHVSETRASSIFSQWMTADGVLPSGTFNQRDADAKIGRFKNWLYLNYPELTQIGSGNGNQTVVEEIRKTLLEWADASRYLLQLGNQLGFSEARTRAMLVQWMGENNVQVNATFGEPTARQRLEQFKAWMQTNPSPTFPVNPPVLPPTLLDQLINQAGGNLYNAHEWNHFLAILRGGEPQPAPMTYLPAEIDGQNQMSAQDYLRYRGLGRVNRRKHYGWGENY